MKRFWGLLLAAVMLGGMLGIEQADARTATPRQCAAWAQIIRQGFLVLGGGDTVLIVPVDVPAYIALYERECGAWPPVTRFQPGVGRPSR